MPTLSITKNYSDGATLTEAHLDTALEGIETFVNTTKLDSDNIQDGALDADTLASNAVTTAKINASAVTTAKIADAAVTGAKLAAAIVDDSTIQIASNVIKIKDAGVTQAKMAVRATGTSVAAGGVAFSTSSGSFSTASTTAVDVTNLSVTIVTTGRPVFLGLTNDTSSLSRIVVEDGNSGVTADLMIVRDSTTIFKTRLNSNPTAASANLLELPPGIVFTIDAPSSGTYTYKIQALTGSGDQLDISNVKLVAYEL